MKKKIFLYFFLCLAYSYTEAQSFSYVGALQTYWKYRYRLVGDYVTSDSLPAMGEPGFLIVNTFKIAL